MWLRMDAAVDGYGRGGYGGRDVAGEMWRGDVAGRDVAREEWGKRRLFVVPLDRVSRRRMCEGWRHPDAGVGLGMKGREGVERWGRWVKKGGQGGCVGNGGDAVSCLDGRSDNFTDSCGLVVVSCACSGAVGAFGMLKPDVFSGGPDRV